MYVAAGSERRASADELVLASKVEAMTGYGLSASDIACVLEIEEDALLANYGHQLRAGPIKANARVAESLYRKALGEDRQAVTAAIFWLKTIASWKETSVHELKSKGQPSQFDLRNWTDAELEAVIEQLGDGSKAENEQQFQ